MKRKNILIINFIIIITFLLIFIFVDYNNWKATRTIVDKTKVDKTKEITSEIPSEMKDLKNVKRFDIATKKISKFDDTKGLSATWTDSLEIKSWFKISKNSLDNIISNCDFLEGKIDYFVEEGKKIHQTKKEIPDIVRDTLKTDKREEELASFNLLIDWKIDWKYKLISNKDFDRSKFKDNTEFYSYLGLYLMSLKNEQELKVYTDLYLIELKKEKVILDENYVLPLTAWVFYITKSCKSFIEENFIMY